MDEAQKQLFYETFWKSAGEQITNQVPELFPAVVMVQAAVETYYNVHGVSQGRIGWNGTNNFAGISPGGQIANYRNGTDYAQAYVSVIRQNGFGYPAVLAAKTEVEQMVALGSSEWARSHYSRNGEGPGTELESVYGTDKALIEGVLVKAAPTPAVQAAKEKADADDVAALDKAFLEIGAMLANLQSLRSILETLK